MARSVARRWLQSKARQEYRLTVYQTSYGHVRNLPSLLRSLRDGRVKLGSVTGLSDMGVKEGFDSLSVWSSNYEGLKALNKWLTCRGVETSGIW